MDYNIIRASERGHADHGWLKTYFSFSFADYYDPKRIHFGTLRVLNDDIVLPKYGFGMHPHQNMEIITIPMSGKLEHEDSMGSKGVVGPDEVQVMSAGRGIMHSERNPFDEPVNLFQIWIFTNKENADPRYEQKKFDRVNCLNKLQLLVSPDSRDESLWIHQQAYISRIITTSENTFQYTQYEPENDVLIMVAEGNATINSHQLNRRDTIEISGGDSVDILADSESHLLFIEIPKFNG